MNNTENTSGASPFVSLIRRLWKKYVNKETILYLVFGVGTTIVNYVIFYLFMHAPFIEVWSEGILKSLQSANPGSFTDFQSERISTLIVNIIAWIFAVAFAYVTNKLFVFESRSWRPSVVFPEISKFILARLLSLGFEEVFLLVTVTICGMNEYIGKILAAVFVVIANYFASKLLIFKGAPATSEQEGVEAAEAETITRENE